MGALGLAVLLIPWVKAALLEVCVLAAVFAYVGVLAYAMTLEVRSKSLFWRHAGSLAGAA